jgi:hypothetical protein
VKLEMLSQKGKIGTALAAPVVVALAAIAVVAPSLDGGFLNWDDDRFVVENDHVERLSAENVAWAFSGVRFELYQPLYLVSFMVDGSLWGGRPLGYRLHNLALFAACALLLYALLRRFGFARLPAAMGALLFTVAPYRIESVAWISSRKDLLMLLFALVAWHLHSVEGASRRKAIAWRALAALAFCAALLAKSGAVVVPFMMLVADLLVLRRGVRRSLLGALPYAIPAALAAIAAPVLFAEADLLARPVDPSPLGRAALVGWSLAHYLRTAAWPFALSPLYAEPAAEALRGPAVAGAASLVVAIALVLAARSRGLAWRPSAAALAIFLVGLAPYLNLVPIYYVVSDRYLLLPSLGCALGAAALARWAVALRGRGARIAVAALAVAVLVAFGAAAAREARAWRGSVDLWTHAVARQPDAFFARLKAGETLREAGEPEESSAQYREARRIRPGSPTALAGVFWGELLADARSARLAAGEDERIVSAFLAAVNDGRRLERLSHALEQRGLRRAAAVVEARYEEWRRGGSEGSGPHA